MTNEQKEFFKTLELNDDQLDKIMENESLFDVADNQDITDLQKQLEKSQADYKELKADYRERFFSVEDNQGNSGKQSNNQNHDTGDSVQIDDDFLNEFN